MQGTPAIGCPVLDSKKAQVRQQIPHAGLKFGRVPFLRQGRRDDN
jgi:hypothetical protein